LKNIAMAKSYIRQAEERVKHAEEALKSGNYAYVVRQCQEAVELALKGFSETRRHRTAKMA